MFGFWLNLKVDFIFKSLSSIDWPTFERNLPKTFGQLIIFIIFNLTLSRLAYRLRIHRGFTTVSMSVETLEVIRLLTLTFKLSAHHVYFRRLKNCPRTPSSLLEVRLTLQVLTSVVPMTAWSLLEENSLWKLIYPLLFQRELMLVLVKLYQYFFGVN